MFRKIFILSLFLIASLMQIAEAHPHRKNVTGIYRVAGIDPVTGPYIGTAAITQIGQVYEGTWTFPDPSGPIIRLNTGVLVDGILSFVFLFEGSYGVISYEIHDHATKLEGKWVLFGTTSIGVEELTLISE